MNRQKAAKSRVLSKKEIMIISCILLLMISISWFMNGIFVYAAGESSSSGADFIGYDTGTNESVKNFNVGPASDDKDREYTKKEKKGKSFTESNGYWADEDPLEFFLVGKSGIAKECSWPDGAKKVNHASKLFLNMLAQVQGSTPTEGGAVSTPATDGFLGTLNKVLLLTAQELQAVSSNSSTTSGSHVSVLNGIFDTAKVIGIGIFFISWLFLFGNSFVKEQFSGLAFVKQMCHLICGFLIIKNCDTFAWGIVKLCYLVNNGIAFSTNGTLTTAYNTWFTNISTQAGAGLTHFVLGIRQQSGILKGISNRIGDFYLNFNAIGGMFKLALPWAASLLCLGSAIMTILKNLIMLLVRVYTAPLTLAPALASGFSMDDIRWVKRTCSLALKPTAIYVCLAAGGAVFDILGRVLGYSGINAILGITLGYFIINGLINSVDLEFD